MRGLNIGGWLVLEKWMTPELYEGYEAEDEYHLLLQRDDAKAMLKKHREEFLTKEDFLWIKDHGMDMVRLPVGHWLFEANAPYVSAKEYVDKAFLWAEEVGLKIVLDVHAAKGCQNGFDNGGLSGVISWHKEEKNILHTLDFIEKLCQVYKEEKQLLGLELLNEPHWTVPIDLLQDFYQKGYEIVRQELGQDAWVILHDGFRIDQWERFFKKGNFINTYLDTHMYQVFGEVPKDVRMEEVSAFIMEKRWKPIKQLKTYTKVVIGEWSCALPSGTKQYYQEKETLDAAYMWLSNQLLLTFEEADAWFFWNYKLSDVSTKKHTGWSFRDLVEKGYLPFK
jgi:glucan 1,3-beta-glucosidase